MSIGPGLHPASPACASSKNASAAASGSASIGASSNGASSTGASFAVRPRSARRPTRLASLRRGRRRPSQPALVPPPSPKPPDAPAPVATVAPMPPAPPAPVRAAPPHRSPRTSRRCPPRPSSPRSLAAPDPGPAAPLEPTPEPAAPSAQSSMPTICAHANGATAATAAPAMSSRGVEPRRMALYRRPARPSPSNGTASRAPPRATAEPRGSRTRPALRARDSGDAFALIKWLGKHVRARARACRIHSFAARPARLLRAAARGPIQEKRP